MFRTGARQRSASSTVTTNDTTEAVEQLAATAIQSLTTLCNLVRGVWKPRGAIRRKSAFALGQHVGSSLKPDDRCSWLTHDPWPNESRNSKFSQLMRKHVPCTKRPWRWFVKAEHVASCNLTSLALSGGAYSFYDYVKGTGDSGSVGN